jgi:hypothetical protein
MYFGEGVQMFQMKQLVEVLSYTLKMEEVCTSETFVLYRSTRSYVPEYRNAGKER